ncbi:cGMP-dependent 3',5'-cyclic phosphodiesterase-like isoform X2 [Ursus americanus]|uniref:cGMP-dependent 3',5'-cyclic phosphodiesterase-like isoform X2 n=1 Tax=Ursus americanus TaxID=9643 RepID=UPI001E67CDF2|nr:cGMP-dependent 3',5'-cyclic phosphodiesterase-like isoform X2 [Ursus americanus]
MRRQPAASRDLLAQEPVPPGSRDARLEDALLSLGSVIHIAGFQRAVKEALSAVLPKVETVYTYLLDGESRLVCEDPPHELPQEGKVREAVVSRKRLGCSGLGPADLPGKPLARLVAPLAPDTQGKGWELGRDREGLCPCSLNHICLLSLSSSLSPSFSCSASPAIPPSNSLLCY